MLQDDRRRIAPSACAASTYWFSFTESAVARTTRAARGMIGMATAITTFCTAGPRIEAMARARISCGKREQNVHHPLEEQIHRPARVGADDTQQTADRAARERRREADEQGDARAIHDAAQHVASELVGPEPVLARSAARTAGA